MAQIAVIPSDGTGDEREVFLVIQDFLTPPTRVALLGWVLRLRLG